MSPQEGQYPIFWLDLPTQYAAQVRKTDKPFEQMGLSLQVADSLNDGMERLIRVVGKKAGALPQQLCHQPEQVQFFFRQTGQKTLAQKFSCIGRTLYNFLIDPICVPRVCWNAPAGKQ